MAARILVVDDSATVLRIVEPVLSGAGYRVFTASSGEDGLAQVRQAAPDLILLDFVMPGLNGAQVCKRLGEDPELAEIPVVMMTTKSEVGSDRYAHPPEVVDFIAKPFSPEAVLAVTSYTLEKHARRAITGITKALPAVEFPQAQQTEPGTDLATRLTTALEASLERSHVKRAGAIARNAAEEALRRLPPSGETAHLAGVTLWCHLSRVPLPEVMQMLEVQRHTGLFQVWYGGTRYDIYLRGGRVVAARAENAASDFWLGRFLVARGHMRLSELDPLVRSASKRAGLPLGEKLVRLGHITAEQLHQAIADQCCELVYEALRARQGTCCFVAGTLPPPEFDSMLVDLGIQALVMEGLRRVDEWGLIESEVEDFDVVFIPRVHNPGGLTSDEQLIFSLVDGQRSVRDLVKLSRMRPFECCKLVYRLAASRRIVRVPSLPAE